MRCKGVECDDVGDNETPPNLSVRFADWLSNCGCRFHAIAVERELLEPRSAAPRLAETPMFLMLRIVAEGTWFVVLGED